MYVRDVWQRLPELLAAATSVHGSILKIDSTKKICKKLLGAAAKTANWETNVGNERGEVVNHPHPILLYTDRECCSLSGMSKYQVT